MRRISLAPPEYLSEGRGISCSLVNFQRGTLSRRASLDCRIRPVKISREPRVLRHRSYIYMSSREREARRSGGSSTPIERAGSRSAAEICPVPSFFLIAGEGKWPLSNSTNFAESKGAPRFDGARSGERDPSLPSRKRRSVVLSSLESVGRLVHA